MINQDGGSQTLVDEIKASSGIDFNSCLHCKTCANGCPFIEGMDYAPNAVIRLIQFGMEEEALKCSTIWVCVGCNTCSSCCPMAIDIPAVMDGLRHKAIEQGVKIAEPDIMNFHTEVLNTVKKYGRTHKLEIMMRYKFKKMDLFSDMGVGLKMLKKRKLDLTPSKIQDKKAIEKIFRKK
ncbi:MAG: 4Fe-4S dicluster domain-containing protein [Deltaproteobacteria bacterium]|uniref:4Fe-4S dicluster domain-containing protein n=1 Tax=Desulfobacula sp. TaxID=2593537 RepID=UPI0019BEEA09|nr:4Fe-4S dicluster domain-containing protein [Candidatus Desulfobacula maris]MBL6992617.1 4Fe-4S dicluster domain-containing protein [Desulfobacula sp.]